jgi:hypothetical protein
MDLPSLLPLHALPTASLIKQLPDTWIVIPITLDARGGTFAGQGDTVVGTPATAGGLCGAGSHDVAYVNTYDIGVYCEGGGCTYGKLYASTGPIPYSQWYSVGSQKIGMQFLKQGPVVLPSGVYGILMGGELRCGVGTGFRNRNRRHALRRIIRRSG